MERNPYIEKSLEQSIEESMEKPLNKYQEKVFRITQKMLRMMYLENSRYLRCRMKVFHLYLKNMERLETIPGIQYQYRNQYKSMEDCFEWSNQELF